MKEKYEKVIAPEGDSDSKTSSDKSTDDKSSKKKSKKSKKEKEQEKAKALNIDVESEYIELLELKKDLTKKLHKNPKSKILKKAINECSADIKKLVKNARKNNTKEYRKLIVGDSTKPNEMNYFKKKMSNAQQLKIMRELKEVNLHIGVDKPYRLALLESAIPSKLKASAMQKINMLRSMDTCDPEYFKIKNWVDTFMRIPFCKYSNLSVSINDGIDKCHEFMANAKETLDKCVYGLDDAKLQILQMIGQWISNPNALGSAIAIKGPPGTGKTTLVKDGISKIFGPRICIYTTRRCK
jgi:ATP-dependent Lon protease